MFSWWWVPELIEIKDLHPRFGISHGHTWTKLWCFLFSKMFTTSQLPRHRHETHTGEALPDTFSQLHTEYGTMNQAAASAPNKSRGIRFVDQRKLLFWGGVYLILRHSQILPGKIWDSEAGSFKQFRFQKPPSRTKFGQVERT